MSALPFIFSREGLREIDRRAVAEFGIPILVLMENAGRGVAEAVKGMHPPARNVLVVAGSGNNGGDGMAAARHLVNAGIGVRVLLVGQREKFREAAGVQLSIVEKMGIAVEEVSAGHAELRDWIVEGEAEDVIVDGIFGTGLSRKVEGLAAEMIEAINAAKRRVVAIDIPSGVDADSGEVLGVAVRARETVSFCGGKVGFARAKEYCGKVVVVDIGVPVGLLRELTVRA